MIASTTAILGVAALIGWAIYQFPPPGIGKHAAPDADGAQGGPAARAAAWATRNGLPAPCGVCHQSGAHEHDCAAHPENARRRPRDPNDDPGLRGLAEDDYWAGLTGDNRKGVGP